jgi:hypothetical protein
MGFSEAGLFGADVAAGGPMTWARLDAIVVPLIKATAIGMLFFVVPFLLVAVVYCGKGGRCNNMKKKAHDDKDADQEEEESLRKQYEKEMKKNELQRRKKASMNLSRNQPRS